MPKIIKSYIYKKIYNNNCDIMEQYKPKNISNSNDEKTQKRTSRIIKPLITSIAAASIILSFSLRNANAWYNNYIPTNPNNTVNPYTASQTYPAVVIGVQHVNINYNQNAGAEGAGIGAGVGGLVGSQFGKGIGKDLATGIGALAGGIAGEHAGKHFAEGPGTQITVKLNNGQLATITEPGNDNVWVGERVFVTQNPASGRYRVIPDNNYTPQNQQNISHQAQQTYEGRIVTSMIKGNETILYIHMNNNGKIYRITLNGQGHFIHGEKVLVSGNGQEGYSVVPY